MATTQVSLVRCHTERMKPPRALWASFELGRPLGAPDDAEFQKRVMMAALELLEEPEGPVLVDFPEDAPAGDDSLAGWSCPVDLSSDQIKSDDDRLRSEFIGEAMRLRPWYDLGREARGRTAVNTSGLDPDGLVRFIASFLSDRPEHPVPEVPLAALLNLAAADLKVYYCESILSRPGAGSPGSQALADWFWSETVAGRLFYTLKDRLRNGEDQLLKLVGIAMIVPVSHSKSRADRG